MTLARFYLSAEQVIIPTVARTEEGFYTDVEPVAVIDIKDSDTIKESMLAVLSRDNPEIPTPARVEEPGSVVLDALGIKKWAVFEKKAVLYTVHKRAESIVVYATGRGADGMWIEQKNREKQFEAETPLVEIVDYLRKDMLEQPEASPPPPPRLLMLPPPRQDSGPPDQGPST